MPVVQLIIGAQRYSVSCGEGQEENLKKMALMLDEKVTQIKKGAPVPEALSLVMGGLLLASDLSEAREELRLRAKNQPAGSPEVLTQVTQLIEKTANQISNVAETMENA